MTHLTFMDLCRILAGFLPVFWVLRLRLRVISNDGQSPTQADPNPVLVHQVRKAVTCLSQPAKVLQGAKRQNPEQDVIWECTDVQRRRRRRCISACFRPPSSPPTVATSTTTGASPLRYMLFIFCHVYRTSYPQFRE